MSGEDETFDIDLYGDDPQDEEAVDRATTRAVVPVSNEPGQEVHLREATQTSRAQDLSGVDNGQAGDGTPKQDLPIAPISQGRKRKATDELSDAQNMQEQPVEPGAQHSIKLSELQWWTTEEDLRSYCATSDVEHELVEIAFNEHKINGKSKGEAYLEFKTTRAAFLTKRAIERDSERDSSRSGGKSSISVWYTAPGNPFKVREGQGKKDASGKYGNNQQGAYNHFPSHNRGGYGGRGRGNYNNAGRGGQWQGQQQQNQSNGFGNQMMGGFGGMPFGGFNPMSMNQNMMNTMMSAASGFGMGMNMPNMMGARGGGNMMNRGGWNGGRGGAPGNNGANTGWDSNKKARKD